MVNHPRHPRVLADKPSASLYQGYAGSMAEATRVLGKYRPRDVMSFRAAASDGVGPLLKWLEEEVPNPAGWEGLPIIHLGKTLEILLTEEYGL